MPNPLFAAAMAAVLGRKRKCPACGKEQVVGSLDRQGRYHCKKCGHVFTRTELKKPR
jgi:transposase-like protein